MHNNQLTTNNHDIELEENSTRCEMSCFIAMLSNHKELWTSYHLGKHVLRKVYKTWWMDFWSMRLIIRFCTLYHFSVGFTCPKFQVKVNSTRNHWMELLETNVCTKFKHNLRQYEEQSQGCNFSLAAMKRMVITHPYSLCCCTRSI